MRGEVRLSVAMPGVTDSDDDDDDEDDDAAAAAADADALRGGGLMAAVTCAAWTTDEAH